MKHKSNETPSIIRNDEKYINDPVAITNTDNNFFTSIAETVQSKSKLSNKSFRRFLSTKNNDSFIITATNTLLHENNAVHQITWNKLMQSQVNAFSEIEFQNGW